jgi:hypothetical protein
MSRATPITSSSSGSEPSFANWLVSPSLTGIASPVLTAADSLPTVIVPLPASEYHHPTATSALRARWTDSGDILDPRVPIGISEAPRPAMESSTSFKPILPMGAFVHPIIAPADGAEEPSESNVDRVPARLEFGPGRKLR